MKPNNIIYADVSTYNPDKTIAFYEKIFGWKFYQSNGYYMAYLNEKPVAGLYKTPKKFQIMQMPHFWMTYIEVSDVHQTVEKARMYGGIIEVEEDMSIMGKVALIRDTQGAGFTIYEGGKLPKTRMGNSVNSLIWNELHVSNAERVIPFYEAIFNWKITEKNPKHFEISNINSEHIADILELSNELKGKYEYWICTFGVKNVRETVASLLENGGNVVLDEGVRMLCTDDSKQAFFYLQEV